MVGCAGIPFKQISKTKEPPPPQPTPQCTHPTWVCREADEAVGRRASAAVPSREAGPPSCHRRGAASVAALRPTSSAAAGAGAGAVAAAAAAAGRGASPSPFHSRHLQREKVGTHQAPAAAESGCCMPAAEGDGELQPAWLRATSGTLPPPPLGHGAAVSTVPACLTLARTHSTAQSSAAPAAAS